MGRRGPVLQADWSDWASLNATRLRFGLVAEPYLSPVEAVVLRVKEVAHAGLGVIASWAQAAFRSPT